MNGLTVPGVYPAPAPRSRPRDFDTGVPLFVGCAAGSRGHVAAPGRAWEEAASRFTSWEAFAAVFGEISPDTYLHDAVRGFFANGGGRCYVIAIDPDARATATNFEAAVDDALSLSAECDDIDLLCMPDASVQGAAAAVRVQRTMLDRAASQHRFAILDSLPGNDLPATVEQWQQVAGARSGGVYFPWALVAGASPAGRPVPPCGHIAGAFAASDRRVGVHKAPANDPLEGLFDLSVSLTDAAQRTADPAGVVNCLRAFPSRGIRVWGARTTTTGEGAWRFVNVVRLFDTTARWMERNLADVVFEPHDRWLWARIRREVNDYLYKLFRAGALKGSTPQEAYFLACDENTTPPDLRERGLAIVELGLAPLAPAEFIVVRFVCGDNAVRESSLGAPTA